jgi:hypothetical protein
MPCISGKLAEVSSSTKSDIIALWTPRLNRGFRGTYNSPAVEGGLHMAETRKVIDCRRFPAEKRCSIVISGTENDVLDVAILHAKTVHGHQDTPELRE